MYICGLNICVGVLVFMCLCRGKGEEVICFLLFFILIFENGFVFEVVFVLVIFVG